MRLISIARSGYSKSSSFVMDDLAKWGEIIALLADAFDLSRLDVLGISSGAPYCHTIGYKLPGKMRKIFNLSGTWRSDGV